MKTDLTLEFLATYLRENTGRSFLDSGDCYGRHYDRPMPTAAVWFTEDYCPIMSLGHFLMDNCLHLPEVQKAFDAFSAESDLTWEKDLDAFFQVKKRKEFYSYNEENALDQDFVCRIFSVVDEWVYDEEAIIVVQSHNGCDARSGFSRPLILSPKDDLSFLFDLSPNIWLDIDAFPELASFEEELSYKFLPSAMEERGFSPARLSDDRQTAYFTKEGGPEIKVAASLPV